MGRKTVVREPDGIAEARRTFLAACGRFAVVTPPTVTLMLSSAAQNFAVATSDSPPRRRRLGSYINR